MCTIQKTYQVVEGVFGDISNLVHAHILESLGLGINHLIVVLTLHLISRHGVPPKSPVDVVSQGLENGLGHVDAAAVLDDLTVDKLGNFSGRVVLGAVELEGLPNGAVIMEHLLQRTGDVNCLDLLLGLFWTAGSCTHVNWPVSLLQVVRNEQRARTGELVKETVLETEHRSGSHNGRFGVDGTDNLLTPSLCGEELGRRVAVGIVGGNMDESVDIVLGDGLGDALGTVNVDVGVGEISMLVNGQSTVVQYHSHSLSGVLATDKVVDDIGVTDALFNRLGVAQVVFLLQSDTLEYNLRRTSYHEGNTAEITSHLQVTLHHFLAVRNHHIASLLSCGASVSMPIAAGSLDLPRLFTT